METFPFYGSLPIEVVMENPGLYIIPENISAIEYLWNMNILTRQTNDYENDDSWISLGMLSKENEEIFSRLRNDPNYLDQHNAGVLLEYGYGFRVPVKPGTKDPLDEFLPLFSELKMQDVQRDGYMTLDEFYAKYTPCFKVIDNPYLALEPNIDNCSSVDEYREKLNDYKRMRYPDTPTIRVFDETKATKSLQEYLADVGLAGCYDPLEGKIFLNRRLYEGHMRYKESLHEGDTNKHTR